MTRRHVLGLILAIASICSLSLYHGCGGGGGSGGGVATFTATITPTKGTLITDPIQINNADHAFYQYVDGVYFIIIGGDGEEDGTFASIRCYLYSLDVGQYSIISPETPATGECSGSFGVQGGGYIAQDDNPGTLSIAASDQYSISGSFDFYATEPDEDAEVHIVGSFVLPLRAY